MNIIINIIINFFSNSYIFINVVDNKLLENLTFILIRVISLIKYYILYFDIMEREIFP